MSERNRVKIVAAAALYFALVFAAGFAFGPIRVLVLEPRLGPALAVLSEAPFLIAVMVFAAGRIPRWIGLSRDLTSMLLMGATALVLQQLADFAVGVLLRGLSPSEVLAQFGTLHGAIYAATLVLFAAAPALLNRSG